MTTQWVSVLAVIWVTSTFAAMALNEPKIFLATAISTIVVMICFCFYTEMKKDKSND